MTDKAWVYAGTFFGEIRGEKSLDVPWNFDEATSSLMVHDQPYSYVDVKGNTLVLASYSSMSGTGKQVDTLWFEK